MNQPRQSTLLAYIDPLRNRAVALLGVLVAVSSFVPAAWLVLAPGAAPSYGDLHLRMLLAQGVLALGAAGLAWSGRRLWGARLLALDLVLIPTLMVPTTNLPYPVVFASYMGVLLVTSIGARPRDVLGLTILIVPLSVLAGQGELGKPYGLAVMASTVGLLICTGASLAWLVEALRRIIVGLEASEAHFHRLSHLDPLTGLGNRRLFDESLTDLLGSPSPFRSVALVVLDVDNLKQINDRHGHPAGDEVLRTVARAIMGSIRDLDIATRIGGDEFAVVLSSGGLRGAQQIASRIRDRIQSLLPPVEGGLNCTVSIGLSEQMSPHQTADELLAVADAQLYANRDHVRKPVPPIVPSASS